MTLPDRDLKRSEVEDFWMTDRQSLVECRKRHKALGEFIEDRDEGLRG